MTLRQLLWMAEGQGRERWAHTSLIAAILANSNRTRNGRAFKPDDFNPYAGKHSGDVIEIDKDTINLMKQAFTPAPGSSSPTLAPGK